MDSVEAGKERGVLAGEGRGEGCSQQDFHLSYSALYLRQLIQWSSCLTCIPQAQGFECEACIGVSGRKGLLLQVRINPEAVLL